MVKSSSCRRSSRSLSQIFHKFFFCLVLSLFLLGIVYIVWDGIRVHTAQGKIKEKNSPLFPIAPSGYEHRKTSPPLPMRSSLEKFLNEERVPFLQKGPVVELLPRSLWIRDPTSFLMKLTNRFSGHWLKEGILLPDGTMVRFPSQGWLLLVMDDLGYRDTPVEELLGLHIPLVFSVLPGAPLSHSIALRVLSFGKDLFLHQPMEPEGYPEVQPGAFALLLSDSPQRWQEVLASNLSFAPGIAGMNNHMGSRFTASEEAMRVVLTLIKERGILFLDSLTTPRSTAPRLCQELAVFCIFRDLFLDHNLSDADLKARVEEWQRISARKGLAIAIAHPHRKTLKLLKEVVPRLEEEKYRFVGIDGVRFWLQYGVIRTASHKQR